MTELVARLKEPVPSYESLLAYDAACDMQAAQLARAAWGLVADAREYIESLREWADRHAVEKLIDSWHEELEEAGIPRPQEVSDERG